ncbi:MAG: pyridoxamine 5'-phosphate oxidase family protein [Gallionella sp.]|nr:pyridoxamine 5'-phosphate oxidase family protein [Gallionella sp.]
MTDNTVAKEPTPDFDPVKLETVNAGKDYPMNPEEFQKLFHHNCYLEMAHINKNGFPIVTPMFYVVRNGEVWVSSIRKHRHKVMDLENNPKVSVCIHNDGANLRHQKAILIIGNAEVSTDDAVMREIHWAILDKYWSEVKGEEQRQIAFKAIHTPLRAVIRIVPDKTLNWDFGKMISAYTPGVWFNEAYEMTKKHQ